MADRELFRDALVSADLFGFDAAGPVYLTTTDPYGVVAINAEETTPLGDHRFTHTIPAILMDTPGVWTNAWSDGVSRTVLQTFTVGRQPLAGVTKHDLRINIASRVSHVHFGIASSEEDQVITDTSLIGGSDEFQYWWVVPRPGSVDAGRFLRVVNYNGSGLVLNEPLLEPIQRGEPYTLMKINPREVDKAIHIAVAELSPLARIELFYDAVVVASDLLTLPAGITHVSTVHTSTGLLTPGSWILRSGRRIGLTATTDETTLGITAIRDAIYPLWEDSILEVDEATTVARAAMHLHANRAAGTGLDQEEHLRRQLAAQEEYERLKRNSVGRIPAGSRMILE
jgi:hypothetical protein